MTDEEIAQAVKDMEDWQVSICPNDLGDDNHRWGWLANKAGRNDIMWMHRCQHPDGQRRPMAGWVDISSGEKHTLVSEDPLHIEPSLLCPVCGDHGFVREGKWVAV